MLTALMMFTACEAPTGGHGKAGDDGTETGDSGVERPLWGFDERPVNTTCIAAERPTSAASVKVTEMFNGAAFYVPVAMRQAPGDNDHYYVVEKNGTIDRMAADGSGTIALSLRDRVQETANEEGLLGFDFHPDWPNTPEIFVNYTAGDADSPTTRISRFTADGDSFDPDSEEILLTVEQPYSNHNGGNVLFGPDGYLYAGFGDGGSSGDPHGNGQNTDALLGKMLRIDVNTASGYTIPADNPFADGVGGAPEVYAWGLRNPWRFSFDSASGDLWVGDVGQNKWEEIDIVERGGDYGWSVMEGAHCFKPANNCDQTGLIQPVYEYSHNNGSASEVGGYVYHGTAIPALAGHYLFADTILGRLWTLEPDENGVMQLVVLIDSLGFQPTSFAEDANGELYLLDYGGGLIYRIDPGGDDVNVTLPATLSETGCADTSTLIPYDVNVPLWSDGAEKGRYLALPEGQSVTVAEDGEWDLPIGSVLRKDFTVNGARTETRLLVRHDDGGWAGYTYQWDGEDASLLAGAASEQVGDTTWTFPSRGECLQCHTAGAGRTLGMETQQLARTVEYPNGAIADQLQQLARIGVIADVPTTPTALPDPAGDAPLADRARAYLDVNCSMCHAPGGTAAASFDVRYSTALADTLTCGVAPDQGDIGVDGALLLTPGDPSLSLLSLRMHATDYSRMPPIASHVVDTGGAALIDAWITSLTGCE